MDGVENEAVEQVAFADQDRLLICKLNIEQSGSDSIYMVIVLYKEYQSRDIWRRLAHHGYELQLSVTHPSIALLIQLFTLTLLYTCILTQGILNDQNLTTLPIICIY